ncbi:MAG: glycosyltransferase family 2 protein [Erysipelotrichales bacterium]|nr:glycosyltransferase family 2 protein [Erysipelotrichales bacterium]
MNSRIITNLYKMKSLLSVIIPVYNVAEYLHQCLESVLAQYYEHIEVIIVNDGSTDNSDEICINYRERDNRIKVINVKNGGAGRARNIGLENCTGDYITFVDADDFISTDSYSSNISYFIIDPEIDILQFPYCRYKDGISHESLLKVEKVLSNKISIYREAYENNILKSYMPNKIFRRKVFEKIRFNESIFFEDREILPSLIENSSKIKFSSNGLYYYRIRPGQTTASFRTPEYLFSEITSYLSIINTLKKYDSLYDLILSIYAEIVHCSKLGEKVLWKEILKNKPNLLKSLSSQATLGHKFLAIKAHCFPTLL